MTAQQSTVAESCPCPRKNLPDGMSWEQASQAGWQRWERLDGTVYVCSTCSPRLQAEGVHRQEEYAAKLIPLLKVPTAASLEDILGIIKTEGWEPCLIEGSLGERPIYAYSVHCGIFESVQIGHSTGRMGHQGFYDRRLAALDALRSARGLPSPT